MTEKEVFDKAIKIPQIAWAYPIRHPLGVHHGGRPIYTDVSAEGEDALGGDLRGQPGCWSCIGEMVDAFEDEGIPIPKYVYAAKMRLPYTEEQDDQEWEKDTVLVVMLVPGGVLSRADFGEVE